MLRGLKSFLILTDRIKAEQGFAFDDLEIRVGNVLFNTNPKIQRTVLMKNTQVQICMYGKVKRQKAHSNKRITFLNTKLTINK